MVYPFMRLSIFHQFATICVPHEVLYQDSFFQEHPFKVCYGLFLREIEYFFQRYLFSGDGLLELKRPLVDKRFSTSDRFLLLAAGTIYVILNSSSSES